MISSVINFAYELPHKLPNNLQLRILGNYILGKSPNWVKTKSSARSPLRKKNLVIAAENYAQLDQSFFALV